VENHLRASSMNEPVHVSSILVKGFKSFKREQRIELKPLTVLAGANSAGKSSFFQLLLLLKQTLESDSDPGPLLLNGDSVKFTELSQLFWRPAGGVSAQTMSIGFVGSDGRVVRQFYDRSPHGALDIHRLEIKTGSLSWLFDVGKLYTIGQLPNDVADEIREGRFGILLQQETSAGRSPKFRVARDGGLLWFELQVLGNGTRGFRGWMPVYLPMRPLADLATGLLHLPGLRGNPERDYPKRAVGNRFPGAFQDYVASIIASWTDKVGQGRLARLDRWVKRLGLGQAVRVNRINDVAYEVVLERRTKRVRNANPAADSVNIADVGLGVSQVLPVLVALLTRSVRGRSATAYVEQPEIHLHPRAQKEMARLMAEEAASGARIVVETHSSVFLLGLQTAIAEGIIKPDDVALYWFKQDDFGATTAVKAHVDNYGRTAEWPADFDDVLLEAQGQYIDAVVKASSKSATRDDKSS